MNHLKELSEFSLTQGKNNQILVLNVLENHLSENQDSEISFYAGLISANLGLFDKSIFYYEQCLEGNPKNIKALYDLGAINFLLGNYDKGISYGELVVDIDSTYQKILQHLANSYSQKGDYSKSYYYFNKALEVYSNDFSVWGDYFLSLNYTNIDIESRKEIQKKFMDCFSSEINFPKINPKSKIRLGYVSEDFKDHAVSYFYKGLITKHSKEKFEVYYYSTSQYEDDITEIYKSSGNFKQVKNSENLYHLIKEDDIDILIDLNGFTRGNSLDVFYNTPAPIQITWLGFLNTLSLASVPYKITDKNLISELATNYYNEELIILDNSLYYDPPTYYPDISESPYSKNQFITFGFFNNFRKITTDVLDSWCSILTSYQNAKLIFIESDYSNHNDALKEVLNSRGFFNIETRKSSNIFEFMNTISEVDIALDPFPHVGGVTTAHSLWMGVPVLTLRGNIEFERISSALLENVGLSDFIGNSKEDYINKGKNIDMKKVIEYRKTLRGKFPSNSIIIEQLESALINIYNKKC
jgi:protein O-GlcNAc transferase